MADSSRDGSMLFKAAATIKNASGVKISDFDKNQTGHRIDIERSLFQAEELSRTSR